MDVDTAYPQAKAELSRLRSDHDLVFDFWRGRGFSPRNPVDLLRADSLGADNQRLRLWESGGGTFGGWLEHSRQASRQVSGRGGSRRHAKARDAAAPRALADFQRTRTQLDIQLAEIEGKAVPVPVPQTPRLRSSQWA